MTLVMQCGISSNQNPLVKSSGVDMIKQENIKEDVVISPATCWKFPLEELKWWLAS